MKKRIVSALLVCVLGMSLVTGCGNNAKAAETTKTADGKIQLDLWYSGGKTAVNVFQDIVDAFNESQDKYEVKTTTQADYTETYEKLQAGIAGKKAPDMALLDTDKSRNLSEKNLVADINEYVEKDDSFEKDDYLPVFYEQGEDENGKLFALPAYGTTQVMYYNKAAFEKAGIDPATIKTWQDLAAAAEKMTASDGSFVGWEPMWGSGNLIDAALSNGASLLSEDGKKVMINSDEWVEVWESFRTWIHDDKIMKVNSGGQGWEYWYTTIDDVLQNSSDEEKEGVYEFMKYFTTPENQAKWSMGTGYVAVRESTQEVEEFKSYAEENPQALVPLQQASHGTPALQDPTGGKILDALSIAADKVELENVPAQEALDEAQKTAQEALDAL